MSQAETQNKKFFWKRAFRLVFLATGIFFLDQHWKKKVNQEKDTRFPRKVPGTKGIVEIRKAHNPGFSMGRLSRFPFLVRFLSVFATFFLFFSLPYFTYLTGDSFFLQELGTALVLSGAASNTLDRVRDGEVTDYLYIRKSFLRKMIINLADIALVFGGACLFFSLLFRLWKRRKKDGEAAG